MQLDRPGGAADAVLELAAAEHVVLGQPVAAADAAGLAHAETGCGVGDERLRESGHVLLQEGGAALGLLATEHLAEGQLDGVARVERAAIERDAAHRHQDLPRPAGGDQIARAAREPGALEVPLEEVVQLEEVRQGRGQVDLLHVEHHRRVLQRVTALGRRAGGEGERGITAGVDVVRGAQRDLAPPGGDRHRLDRVVALERAQEAGMEVDGQARLGTRHGVVQPLHPPRHVRHGGRRLEGNRPVAQAVGEQAVGHLGGEAPDQAHKVAAALAIVEAAERPHAAPGRHPTEEGRVVDQHRAQAGPRRGDGGRRAGRAPTHDDEVGVPHDGHLFGGNDDPVAGHDPVTPRRLRRRRPRPPAGGAVPRPRARP